MLWIGKQTLERGEVSSGRLPKAVDVGHSQYVLGEPLRTGAIIALPTASVVIAFNGRVALSSRNSGLMTFLLTSLDNNVLSTL